MTKQWSSDNDRKFSLAAADHTSEGSALFSLKELKAKAEAAARTAKPQAREENSGLIDLKGLMAEAEKENAREAASALHVTPHIPVYPFGTPTEAPQAVIPQAEPVAAADEVDTKRWRRPRRVRAGVIGVAAALLGIAAVAAAAVGVGLGAFDAPRPMLAMPLPASIHWAAAPSITAPDPATEIASAQPSQTEDDKAKSVATPRPPKEIPHVAKAPVLNRTAEPPVSTPKPPVTATKPANDPCNGDLMCAMQRAVKK
ncbi:MAG TPA: hypothetical protein VE093_26430 [Polyangiaceae bacterium]|nr:hypothetical protein [Polyangiaceae bacterium]